MQLKNNQLYLMRKGNKPQSSCIVEFVNSFIHLTTFRWILFIVSKLMFFHLSQKKQIRHEVIRPQCAKLQYIQIHLPSF